jgi:hypothetical protein
MPLGAMTLESLLPSSPPEGWGLIEKPHLYIRRTLFEHVDGQAELYLKYGFQKSVFAVYQHQKRPENQIEIDICDMGSVLQAFGIFSRLRSEARLGGIGLDSCGDDRSLLFYKGRYFVMLYGTEPTPYDMKEFALTVSARITDSSPPPREIGFFPSEGLRPGSIQYFSEGLLGHQFLQKGFQGTYIEEEKTEIEAEAKVEGNGKVKKAKVEAEAEVGNRTEDEVKVEGKGKVESENEAKSGAEDQPKEFNLFLAILRSTADARNALGAYRNYLTKKGKLQSMVPPEPGPHTLRGEDPYKGNVLVVQKGPYLVGIAGFKGEPEARDRLEKLLGNIK